MTQAVTEPTPPAKPEPVRDISKDPRGPYVPTLGHGGPGICRICFPNGDPKKLQPNQQGDLLL